MSSTASCNQWSLHSLGVAESGEPWPLWPLIGSFVLHVAVGVVVLSMRFPPVLERSEASYHVSLVVLPAQPPTEFRERDSVPDVASLPPTIQQPVEPVAVPDEPETSVQRGEATRPKEEVVTQSSQSARIPAITKPQPPASPVQPAPRVPRRVPHPTGMARVVPPEPPQLTRVPPGRATVERERREPAANLTIPDVLSLPTTVIRQPDFSSTASQGSAPPVAGSFTTEQRYWKRIRDRIHEQWLAAPIDHSRPLHVVLAFRVERTGQVHGLTVTQSSGNSDYDAMARRAVAEAKPFPPFPPTITEPYLDITFKFNFQWVQ